MDEKIFKCVGVGCYSRTIWTFHLLAYYWMKNADEKSTCKCFHAVFHFQIFERIIDFFFSKGEKFSASICGVACLVRVDEVARRDNVANEDEKIEKSVRRWAWLPVITEKARVMSLFLISAHESMREWTESLNTISCFPRCRENPFHNGNSI